MKRIIKIIITVFVVFLVLFTIAHLNSLTVNNVKGAIYLEMYKAEIYSSPNEDYYVTMIDGGEGHIVEFLNDEGYKLLEQHGSIYAFGKGAKEITLSRYSILNKYYIWEKKN